MTTFLLAIIAGALLDIADNTTSEEKRRRNKKVAAASLLPMTLVIIAFLVPLVAGCLGAFARFF